MREYYPIHLLLPGKSHHHIAYIEKKQEDQYIPIPKKIKIVKFEDYKQFPSKSKKFRNTVLLYQHDQSFVFDHSKNKIVGKLDDEGATFHNKYMTSIPSSIKSLIRDEFWDEINRSDWYIGQGSELDRCLTKKKRWF